MSRGASISFQICVLCIFYVSIIPHLENEFKNSKMKSLLFTQSRCFYFGPLIFAQFLSLEPFESTCGHGVPLYLQMFRCVFPKTRDVLLHSHSIVIEIRKRSPDTMLSPSVPSRFLPNRHLAWSPCPPPQPQVGAPSSLTACIQASRQAPVPN